MATDWEAEGLLEGVESDEARAGRVKLLDRLSEDGFGVEELRKAAREGRLPLLPVERLLEGEGPRYSPAEIAERSGLDLDLLTEMRRALGVAAPDPDERILTEEDLEGTRLLKANLDAGIPPESVLELARVLGQSMSTVAAAVARAFGEVFLEPGDTELEVAERMAAATEALAPSVGRQLEHIFKLHQRELLRRAMLGNAVAAGEAPGSEEVTVCFADLVGFTKLGESVPSAELGAVAQGLTGLAVEAARPPVRLVKMIGDAAMLVSPKADPVLDAALRLVESAEEKGEDFPLLRVGLARGEALPRAGDWYGAPVNLASRITSFARPGSVVADEAVREAAAGDYAWSFAGKRRFKGVREEVTVFRVRRPEPEAA